MEIVNWLGDKTAHYNWLLLLIIIYIVTTCALLLKNNDKKTVKEETLSKSIIGLNSRVNNQEQIIKDQTKQLKEYSRLDLFFRDELVKFNDTLEYITTMPIGVKANNFTYKSFIYKKEKGAFAESKKNGKITLIKGELGYIINDSFFLSLKNFEAKLRDVNLRIQEIIDNTNNEIDYDILFTFQVEGLRSNQVVALA